MEIQSANSVVVNCDGPLVIGTIPEIHARVLGALNSHHSVVVRVGDDVEFDLTFLQLIVSANRTAQALGRKFSVSAPQNSALISKLKSAGHLDGELAIRGDAS